MPDGWEIEHRRWIGDIYTGGNLWTLDPRDPPDANMDADGDGLDSQKVSEDKWGLYVESVALEGLPTHGENASAAQSWTKTRIQIIQIPMAIPCQMVGRLAINVHG